VFDLVSIGAAHQKIKRKIIKSNKKIIKNNNKIKK
jgi:hypothetical protein